MKIRRSFQLVAATIAVSIPALAQQSLVLSVNDAVEIAFDKSKTLHASMMKVRYADALSSDVSTLLLPSLKFGGAYTRLSSVPAFQVTLPPPISQSFVLAPAILDNYSLRLTLQQPLFTGWKLRSAADAAEQSALAAAKDYDKDKSDLAYRSKAAYWNLSKAIAIEKVVSDLVEQVKAHLKDAQNLQAQGLTTTNDVLKVQVQYSEAQLHLIDARNAVRLALINLNNTIGLPLETEVELKSELRQEHQDPGPLPSLIETALDRRADLKAMEFRVKAGEAGVRQAHSAWYPQIILSGNYYSNKPNQRYQPVQDRLRDSWDINVGVSFDIWNWGSAVHQSDEANAQLAQVQDGMGVLRDAVALDVTSNFLNLKRADEQIAVAEQGVRQAEENYRVTNGRFKQGLSTNTDLLDAETALLQARTDYTQSLTDHELALAGLERALGR